MAGFLEGIIPPIVTPFEADGRLDLASFEAVSYTHLTLPTNREV